MTHHPWMLRFRAPWTTLAGAFWSVKSSVPWSADIVLCHRRIQEITPKIENIREECKLLQIVSAGHIEEKLSGFAEELKQQVDRTQVLPFLQRHRQSPLVADEVHISSQWS